MFISSEIISSHPGQSRPAALPPADADLVVVEEVDLRGEADVLGIRAGDVLRAVSYVGTGPEPGWLDQMLGAKAMPMKKVWNDVAVIWSVALKIHRLERMFWGHLKQFSGLAPENVGKTLFHPLVYHHLPYLTCTDTLMLLQPRRVLVAKKYGGFGFK